MLKKERGKKMSNMRGGGRNDGAHKGHVDSMNIRIKDVLSEEGRKKAVDWMEEIRRKRMERANRNRVAVREGERDRKSVV